MSARLGDIAVLDGLEAAHVVQQLAGVRDRFRRNGASVPEALDQAITTLEECAELYWARLKAGSAIGTSQVPEVDRSGSEAVDWMSTSEAAKEIGISDRAVTKAARKGRYASAQHRGGAWEIARTDVERHRDQRRQGTA